MENKKMYLTETEAKAQGLPSNQEQIDRYNRAVKAARTVDDIASDFANASSDQERAQLIREMDAVNAQIADEHLKAGNVNEYQVAIGRTHQAHRPISADGARTMARMQRGEI